MSLSIGIIHWNAGERLARCLESFSRVDLPDETEILVVDNASASLSTQLVARFPNVRWILNKFNAGFAGAANQVLDSSSGEVVLFCNPDVEATPGSVIRLYEQLHSSDSIAVAAPALLDLQGHLWRGSVRRLPSLLSVTRDLLFLDELLGINRNAYSLQDPPRQVQQPAGACLMVRRRALLDIGRWDEQFHPAWFEDVDLCRRLRSRSWKIVWVPASRFIHAGGCSLETLGFHPFLTIYYCNLRRYFKKHHHPLAVPYLAVVTRLALLLRRVFVKRA